MDQTGAGGADARMPSGFAVRERTDTDLEAVAELTNRHVRPVERESATGFRRWAVMNPMPTQLALVVTDQDGALVAHANASDGGVWAQADRSWRGGLIVDRAVRGRGIGRALQYRLEAHARGHGASRINSRVRSDEPDALAFAIALGYAEYHRRYNSYLEVPIFDEARFEDPAAVAERAGVRLATLGETWDTAADEEAFLRRFYAANREYTADVPFPDPFVLPPFEAIRKMLFESPTLDRAATILVLRAGQIVGFTMTDVSDLGIGHTFMTGVARAERGKGLALALKLRAIAALRARGVQWFGTTNDEANAPMRGINRRLGYLTDPAQVQVRKLFTVS